MIRQTKIVVLAILLMLIGSALVTVSPSTEALAQSLPSTLGWYQIPNSALRAACPPNGFGGSGYSFASLCQNVTEAWNSAVFDTARNRLIIWGGGHNDYYGNELYALNLSSLTMQRITDPGVPVASCQDATANGTQAASRHTYDGIAYMANVDRMFVFGGAFACPAGSFNTNTWTFNFAASRWEKQNPSGSIPRGDPGIVTAYDPNTGKVFVHDSLDLYAYTYSSNSYQKLTANGSGIDYHLTGVIDPVRKKFVLIGAGEAWIYDISPGSSYTKQALNTSGGSAIINSGYPGLAYDPVSDRIVAWNGGNTVYSLNLSTNTWTATTNSGGPGAALPNGTYKRWSYSPASGAFVVVNSVDQNAFAFRLSASSGTTPPPPPIDTSAPAIPSGLAGTGVSSSQVNLSWNSSTDNVAVTGYRVYRAGVTIGSTSSTSYQDSNLSPSTTYAYTVAAYDAAGNVSGQSSAASATTLGSGTPPTTTAGTTLLVKFGSTSGLNTFGLSGWSTVLKDIYTEYQDIGPGGMTIVVGNNYSYNFQGITGSARNFSVGEKILITWFNNSNSAVSFTPNISFTDPDRISMGATGTWYPMNYTTVPALASATSEFTFSSASAGQYVLVNVNVNYPNTQVIVADRIELVGGGSSTTIPPTTDKVAPSNPGALVATSLSSSLIALSWSASSDNVGVTFYRLERCQGSACSNFTEIATPVATSFTDSGLTNSTSYRYRVRATDAAANLSGYSSVAGATTSAAVTTGASETVTVNFAVDRGVATYRASGFLHSISSTQPSVSLVNPIKPKLFRCRESICFDIYNRVTPLGANVQVVISDSYGYGSSWPGSGGNYANWENTVKNVVNRAKTNGYTMQWDIWNEPNLGQFWNASQAQFFETWRRAHVAIRAIDPNATIVGPSVSGFDQSFIQSFLSFAKTNNVLPDIVSWHEFNGGSVIPGNVQAIRNFMAANGINISRISLNEIIHQGEYTYPGATVRYLAAVERSGVDSAAHACWGDTGGDNCSSKSLDGILTLDGQQARSAWWAYKGYADVTGNLVDVTASANVDGVAGRDGAAQKAAVVLGRTGGTGSVGVRFTNISSAAFLNGGGTVRVLAQRITDSNTSALTSPTTVINSDYSVTNNEVTVILSNFGSTEAYTITLSPGAGGGTADTTPPTVALSAPVANGVLSGTITVSANASDNVGVVGVQFKLDGANLGPEDIVSPYSVPWNTSNAANGSHVLTAVARDTAGNQTTSTTVTVTVNNVTAPPPPPADTTPPSIPSNLSASALSTSQINLSWSGSTDNVGVTGYRVYRGGAQVATVNGTTFQDNGLSESSSYSYNVAAHDAAENVSGQSPTAIATTLTASIPPPTTPPPTGATVVSFTITSPSSLSAAPFTLGHPFRQGDIPSGSSILANIPNFQATIKSRWPDGSAQFAILSGRATLQANTPLRIDLSAGTASSGAILTEADLQNRGANALVSFSGAGSVDLSNLIGTAGSYSTSLNRWTAGKVIDWITGPEMSSWVYSAPIGSDPFLTAWFEVKLWKDGQIEILPWIENGFLNKAGVTQKSGTATVSISGSQRFTASLTVLHHTRTPLVSGSTFSHFLGSDPKVTFKHDTPYLSATRVVPTYGATTSASSPAFSRMSVSYSPFGQANYPEVIGSGGYDLSIGLLPEWDVLYLTSRGDARALAAVVVNAYSAGRYGIHFRDEKTNRPLRFSSYPNLVISDSSSIVATGASSTGSYTPTTGGANPPQWATSHAPSVGYLAYILHGRFYFLEQSQFAASVIFLKQNDTTRQSTKGILETSAGANIPRGVAWGLRSYTHAFLATPDNDALKTEFRNALDENISYYHGRYVAQPNNPQGFLAPYDDYTSTGDNKWSHAAWQEDFLTAVFGYIRHVGAYSNTASLGTKLTDFYNWKARAVIGRLGLPGVSMEFDFRDAAQYNIFIAPSDSPNFAGGTGPWYANWGQIYSQTLGANAGTAATNQLRGAYFPEPTSYWGNLQPAIAYAVTNNVPGASAAYSRMTGASNWSQIATLFNDAPVWSVVPSTSTPVPPPTGTPTAPPAPSGLTLLQ